MAPPSYAPLADRVTAVKARAAAWLRPDVRRPEHDGRASSLQDARRQVTAWARTYGVSRVANVTGLDRVGIPNAHAVRPLATHPCAIVSSGKGRSLEAAQTGALFESFERWAAEAPGFDILASRRETATVCPWIRAVVPSCLTPDQQIRWVLGFDPFTGMECLVPVDCVAFPRDWPDVNRIPGYSSSTDGIASGTVPSEAISAALFELIERHAVAHIDINRLFRIDERSIPDESAALVERFRSAGIDLSIVYCPSPTKISTFYVLSRDDVARQSVFFCSGSGCHSQPRLALDRALLELSQSRASFVSSIRPDVGQRIAQFHGSSYGQRRRNLDRWFTCEPTVDFREISVPSGDTFHKMLHLLKTNCDAVVERSGLACVVLSEFPGLYACRLFAPDLSGP